MVFLVSSDFVNSLRNNLLWFTFIVNSPLDVTKRMLPGRRRHKCKARQTVKGGLGFGLDSKTIRDLTGDVSDKKKKKTCVIMLIRNYYFKVMEKCFNYLLLSLIL